MPLFFSSASTTGGREGSFAARVAFMASAVSWTEVGRAAINPRKDTPRHLPNPPARGAGRTSARRRTRRGRSEEHTSELQSLMRISYAVFCLKTKIQTEQDCTNIKCTNN